MASHQATQLKEGNQNSSTLTVESCNSSGNEPLRGWGELQKTEKKVEAAPESDAEDSEALDAALRFYQSCSTKTAQLPAEWIAAAKEELANDSTLKELILFVCEASKKDLLASSLQTTVKPDESRIVAAVELLRSRPVEFLSRFGYLLSWQQLDYILCQNAGDRQVASAVRTTRQASLKANQHVRVRNRRFKALQQLKQKGEYFSEEEMRRREPLLFDQMIGRYLSKAEADSRVCQETAGSFASVLMQRLTREQDEEKRQQQLQEQDSQREEVESDSEDSDMETESENTELSASDKEELRHEFLRIMQHKFLSGQDPEFDYREVDNNTAYDDETAMERDEQEHYFEFDSDDDLDAERAETSEYTGIQDY